MADYGMAYDARDERPYVLDDLNEPTKSDLIEERYGTFYLCQEDEGDTEDLGDAVYSDNIDAEDAVDAELQQFVMCSDCRNSQDRCSCLHQQTLDSYEFGEEDVHEQSECEVGLPELDELDFVDDWEYRNEHTGYTDLSDYEDENDKNDHGRFHECRAPWNR